MALAPHANDETRQAVTHKSLSPTMVRNNSGDIPQCLSMVRILLFLFPEVMTMKETLAQVIAMFDGARNETDHNNAKRAACRLQRAEQLDVCDAARASRARLNRAAHVMYLVATA